MLFAISRIFLYYTTEHIQLIPETIETINYLISQDSEFKKKAGESAEKFGDITELIIRLGKKPYLFLKDNKIKIDSEFATKIVNLNSNLLNRKISLMEGLVLSDVDPYFKSEQTISAIKDLFIEDKRIKYSPIGGIVTMSQRENENFLTFYPIKGRFQEIGKGLLPLAENPDGLIKRLQKSMSDDNDELLEIWDRKMINLFITKNLKRSKKLADRIKFSKYIVNESFMDLADATYRPSEDEFINLLLENKLAGKYLGNFVTMNFGGFEVPNRSSFVGDDDRWFAITLRPYGFSIFYFDKKNNNNDAESLKKIPEIRIKINNFTGFFKMNVD